MREICTSGSTRGQQATLGHLLPYSTGQAFCAFRGLHLRVCGNRSNALCKTSFTRFTEFLQDPNHPPAASPVGSV